MNGAESGGAQVAKLLKEDVTKYTKIRLGEIPRHLIARVYGNLKSLSSNVIENSKLTRSLGGFAAGFSRQELFDFVDVVDEEAVENKIVGGSTLRHFK